MAWSTCAYTIMTVGEQTTLTRFSVDYGIVIVDNIWKLSLSGVARAYTTVENILARTLYPLVLPLTQSLSVVVRSENSVVPASSKIRKQKLVTKTAF